MASAEQLAPGARWEVSAAKIAPPFELDPSLCLYSPQDNVDAFVHPRVLAHHQWLREQWTPPAAAAAARITLLLPCTAAKPYPVSPEHREVNAALLDAGWRPATDHGAPPRQLLERRFRRRGASSRRVCRMRRVRQLLSSRRSDARCWGSAVR